MDEVIEYVTVTKSIWQWKRWELESGRWDGLQRHLDFVSEAVAELATRIKARKVAAEKRLFSWL